MSITAIANLALPPLGLLVGGLLIGIILLIVYYLYQPLLRVMRLVILLMRVGALLSVFLLCVVLYLKPSWVGVVLGAAYEKWLSHYVSVIIDELDSKVSHSPQTLNYSVLAPAIVFGLIATAGCFLLISWLYRRLFPSCKDQITHDL